MGLPVTFSKYLDDNRGAVITRETRQFSKNDNIKYTSFDSIFSAICPLVGRFAEHHSHDFLISYLSMIDDLKEAEDGYEDISIFGIRESGVDGNTFTFIRLRDNKDNYAFVDSYYRRVIGVIVRKHINAYKEIEVEFIVKDISGISFDEHDADFTEYN